nr:unnamed protein product [Callosobruchus analis]
MAKNTFARG